MTGPERPLYRIDSTIVDSALACLRRDGAEIHLRNKSLQTLLYLIDHRDRLVSKDELVMSVWDGAAVTDDTVVQCVREIRKALNDNSVEPRYIRTVPKAGYRFIGPVEEIGRATSPDVPDAPDAPDAPRRSRVSLIAISAVLAVLAIGGAVWLKPARASAENGAPRTIALMPFVNQSATEDLDWLERALPDMLITGLSRTRALTIVNRAQLPALEASGAGVTLEKALAAARKRSARVGLLGSFAKIGSAIRIDVQLYDVESETLLGAESLTIDSSAHLLRDVDLLSIRLAGRFGGRVDGPAARTASAAVLTDNLEAFRAYWMALERANAYDSTEALRLLERATTLDPRFAMAYARIGYVYNSIRVHESHRAKPYFERAFQLSDKLTDKDKLYVQAWYADASGDRGQAIEHLRKMVADYPDETEAYWRLGKWLIESSRPEEAADAYERGLAIDPDAKDIWNSLGFLYNGLTRYDRAIAAHERYVALDPDEPNAHDSLAITYGQAGRWSEAVAECDRALALNPSFHFAFAHKGDAFVHMGRYRDAIREYRRYIDVAPSDWDRAMGHHNVALVLARLGEFEAAAAEARFETRFQNNFGGQLRVALMRGDIKTAAALGDEYFGTNGKPGTGRQVLRRDNDYFRAELARLSGRTDEAIELLKRSLAVRHVEWGLNSLETSLGDAYFALSRYDDAVREFERVLMLNPRDALTIYRLARAHDHAGRAAKARQTYRQFLDLWKDADRNIPEVIDAERRAG